MRKPLHIQYLGPALLLALWFALAEPLACIGYYQALAPATAAGLRSNAHGALPANPNCFRAAGGPAHDAGAPPSPVHELLAEGSPQIQTIARPHILARAPQLCRPSANPPPPTPPPRHLAPTVA